MLTARDFRKFTVLISDSPFHYVTPRPLIVIRITAVILGIGHATLRESWIIKLVMGMGRLWVPTLTTKATESYRGFTWITICINVYTQALVWKKQVSAGLVMLGVNKCTQPVLPYLVHVMSDFHCSFFFKFDRHKYNQMQTNDTN